MQVGEKTHRASRRVVAEVWLGAEFLRVAPPGLPPGGMVDAGSPGGHAGSHRAEAIVLSRNPRIVTNLRNLLPRSESKAMHAPVGVGSGRLIAASQDDRRAGSSLVAGATARPA